MLIYLVCVCQKIAARWRENNEDAKNDKIKTNTEVLRAYLISQKPNDEPTSERQEKKKFESTVCVCRVLMSVHKSDLLIRMM